MSHGGIWTSDAVCKPAQPVPGRGSDVKWAVIDPVAVVQGNMEEVELPMAGEEASHQTHSKLTVVCDLPWGEFPAATTRHRHCELDERIRTVPSLKLPERADGVTNEGAQHASET